MKKLYPSPALRWPPSRLAPALLMAVLLAASAPPAAFATDEAEADKEPAESKKHETELTVQEPLLTGYSHMAGFFITVFGPRLGTDGDTILYGDNGVQEGVGGLAPDESGFVPDDGVQGGVGGYIVVFNGGYVIYSLDEYELELVRQFELDSPAESILDSLYGFDESRWLIVGDDGQGLGAGSAPPEAAPPPPTPEQQAQVEKALKNAGKSPGLTQALQDFGTPEVKAALSKATAAPNQAKP